MTKKKSTKKKSTKKKVAKKSAKMSTDHEYLVWTDYVDEESGKRRTKYWIAGWMPRMGGGFFMAEREILIAERMKGYKKLPLRVTKGQTL